MVKNYRVIKHTILIITVFALTACANSNVPGSLSTPYQAPIMIGGGAVFGAIAGGTTASSSPLVGAAVGGVVGGAIGGLVSLYADSYSSVAKKLQGQGVQIIQQGNSVRIVIPSDACFELCSANLQESYEPTLQNLAALLKFYGATPMTISGYTDNVMEAQQAQFISRAQADSLVAYFWAHGIPYQYFTAVGRGMQCPIAQNDTVVGSAQNRRIEITLNTYSK